MNAEIQTPVNFSRRSIRDGLARSTVLRSTLLGEYGSLLMMAHALFGAIWWAAAVPKCRFQSQLSALFQSGVQQSAGCGVAFFRCYQDAGGHGGG